MKRCYLNSRKEKKIRELIKNELIGFLKKPIVLIPVAMVIYNIIKYYIVGSLSVIGLVCLLVDLVVTFIVCTLSIKQKEREQRNYYIQKNKKRRKSLYVVPLLDQNSDVDMNIRVFKLMFSIILSILFVGTYYFIGTKFYSINYMNVNQAIEFVMYFIFIPVFDIFFKNIVKFKDVIKSFKEGSIKFFDVKQFCELFQGNTLVNNFALFILIFTVTNFKYTSKITKIYTSIIAYI